VREVSTATHLHDIGEYDEQFAETCNKVARFKVDSALLRELGERLVGKPYIALAELVKNAYDADASLCIVELTEERIEVSDDGHGMTETEFLDFWMTVGTRHKQQRDQSKRLKRQVTGSKGIGRLSAQFLAEKMQLLSTHEGSNSRLHAFVDWENAIDTGSLTEAEASYRIESSDSWVYPENSRNGTVVVLHGLKQEWNESEISDLGRQIWMLNSPIYLFGKNKRRKGDANDFRVIFRTDLPGVDRAFESKLTQALKNYEAIISGEIARDDTGSVSLVKVEFKDEVYSERFDCPEYLREANWEVRIYNLSGRQSGGISVIDMREYFEKYGGVTVFDKGFRLPYYGAENDWLGLEYDHSHRKNRSKLLPDYLHVPRALNDLPTQGRIFGVVNVNTSRENQLAEEERKDSGEFLKIQVSRDRLVGNKAYIALKESVRRSIDYYATLKRSRVSKIIDFERPSEKPESKLRRLRELVDDAKISYPSDETIVAIEKEVKDTEASLERSRVNEEAAKIYLGPLAAAGMAAIAIEHETKQELTMARSSIKKLDRIARDSRLSELAETVMSLSQWIDHIEVTRRIFLPLMQEEDRERVVPVECDELVRTVAESMQPLMGRTKISFDLHQKIHFPPATRSEWSALLQNVLLNSANATLDSVEPKVKISTKSLSRYCFLIISDNGVGIGENSGKFFKPFVRESKISLERRELGVGGTGLGLTIVELIAENRNCSVSFIDPESDQWSTTFEMRWRLEG